MAGLWLNQCGETDATRQSFSCFGSLTSDAVNVISGDWTGVHWSYNRYDYCMVTLEMDPGWWLIEFHGYTSGSYWGAVLMSGFWWKSVTEFASHPPTWDESFSGWTAEHPGYDGYTADPSGYGYTWTAPFKGILGDSGSPCQRVAILFQSFAPGPGFLPATGETGFIEVTGLRLACPDCPEPI